MWGVSRDYSTERILFCACIAVHARCLISFKTDNLRLPGQVIKYVLVIPGIPKLITADMVKEGAAVIDVGINHIHDPVTGKTKLVGDVDFEGQWNTLSTNLLDKYIEVCRICLW